MWLRAISGEQHHPSIRIFKKLTEAFQADPRKFNSGIVKPVITVLNNALVKNRDKRYQKASLMCTHLRQIGKRIDSVMAQRKEKNRS